MIPETENPQEEKSVSGYAGKPARHTYADLSRYITHRAQRWFSRGTAQIFGLFCFHLGFSKLNNSVFFP